MTGGVHMPALSGASAWINSGPLEPADLRGHVVLVDFWTLTCINWLRTEPYVRAWARTYRDDGLIVIGVHTPEFSFEHEVELVRQATRERDIDYPVVVDSDYAIWTAFDNHYWPALYFVDKDGRHPRPPLRRGPVRGVRAGHPAAARGGPAARRRRGDRGGGGGRLGRAAHDETYVGYGRGEHFASPDGAAFEERSSYHLPANLPLNHWALSGDWTIGREKAALDGAAGSIAFRFRARDANLVLDRSAPEPIPFRVLLDGAAPGPSHGVDVDADGAGVLGEGRLYQLVRQQDGRARAHRGDHLRRRRRAGVRVHVRVTSSRIASSGCSTGIGRPTAASTRPGSSIPPAASHAGGAWPAGCGGPAG
jgi:thiol-disulfide isomerase/thioredoxin